MSARSRADRALVVASVAIALAAIVSRVLAIVAYPPIYDWDAAGHAVNVVDLLELRWPDPRSWCGSHPPLYYGLGAASCLLLPDAVPMHVTLRLLSAGAWLATIAVVWRSLRALGGTTDAAVVATLLLGAPGLTIASSMMTNDALCAFFVTATLARLLATAGDGPPAPGHAAVTGVFAGLAALSKATGIAAVGMAGACYLWRARRDPRRGVTAVLVFGAASAAVVAIHYLRLFLTLDGSLYDILAVRAGSSEKEAIATAVHEIARLTAHVPSFAGLAHRALWGDPTNVFLPRGTEDLLLTHALAIGGLLVTAVAVAGTIRVLARTELRRRTAVVLVFGAAYLIALVPHAVDRPYIVLTKSNYVLPEALPAGLVLMAGAGWARGGIRTALLAMLLVVAGAGVALTGQRWWTPPASAQTQTADGAAAAVERWFVDRARDPVHALRALAPREQLAHGLRMAPLLEVPLPPERARSADEDRALELARARVAWLELYNLLRWIQPVAAALDPRVLSVSERDGAADVRVRIGPASSTPPAGLDVGPWPFPPFEQRFLLERVGSGWRIVDVEQAGVSPENVVPAFVAHPTRAGFEQLRALGWRPPWADGIAVLRQGAP